MYWLVSLPHGGLPDRVWNQLQELTTYTNDHRQGTGCAVVSADERLQTGSLAPIAWLPVMLCCCGRAQPPTAQAQLLVLAALFAAFLPP